MNHNLGRFVAEAGFTWDKTAVDNEKSAHGLFKLPLHLRLAHNMKLADGVTYDSVQSLGKNFKSRDRIDFQLNKNTKVSIVGESDLKQTFNPSSMLK